mmetsp:Transcript_102241/g.287477  ORF Transcript_102241/g.287477 Transcript_102241/m.287477 type:complete len:305 (+) Transcript_102241:19-933(+)
MYGDSARPLGTCRARSDRQPITLRVNQDSLHLQLAGKNLEAASLSVTATLAREVVSRPDDALREERVAGKVKACTSLPQLGAALPFVARFLDLYHDRIDVELERVIAALVLDPCSHHPVEVIHGAQSLSHVVSAFVLQIRTQAHPQHVRAIVEHDLGTPHVACHLIHEGRERQAQVREQGPRVLVGVPGEREDAQHHQTGLVAEEAGVAQALKGVLLEIGIGLLEGAVEEVEVQAARIRLAAVGEPVDQIQHRRLEAAVDRQDGQRPDELLVASRAGDVEDGVVEVCAEGTIHHSSLGQIDKAG